MGDELILKLGDEHRVHRVKMSSDACEDDGHLVLHGHWYCNTQWSVADDNMTNTLLHFLYRHSTRTGTIMLF